MRIAVVNTQTPFVRGGAEMHADNLVTALRDAGHEAELITIPFNNSTAELIIDQAVAAANFDISTSFRNRIDLMIGLRFPAYLIRHENKVLWMLHQYREAYDLWHPGSLSSDPAGGLARRLITKMDQQVISSARKVFANSKNVANRMMRFNGLEAEALYHPPPITTFRGDRDYADFIYYPSRVSELKRQLLCLEAASLCKHPVRLVFTGAADNEPLAREFHRKVEELDLGDRIEWRGFVKEEERTELYEKARAILFTPLDEDLGYVTLEAMAAGKAVITTSDSGGPLEFVDDDQTGLVSSPTAKDLARALDRLWEDKNHAIHLGRAAKEKYERIDISWTDVVNRLTEYP